MLEPRNRKMRLFARMVESADTEVSKTSALGRVGSSPTLSTSKFSVYKTLSRTFSNISRYIGEQISGPMAQWERRCFASIRFGVRVPVGPPSVTENTLNLLSLSI